MALPPDKRTRLTALTGRGLGRLIGYVRRTSKVVAEPADVVSFIDRQNPAILAFWHGQFMMLPAFYSGGFPFSAMVAKHGDAELIGEALQTFGIGLIRGAGAGSRQRDRGGAQALRQSVRALSEGMTLAMTADVPPGPARVAGLGIITIARMSGRPIVPVAVATSRYRSLPTWSRMTINLPYSTIAAVAGEPIAVPREADEAGIHGPSSTESRPTRR